MDYANLYYVSTREREAAGALRLGRLKGSHKDNAAAIHGNDAHYASSDA